MKKIITILLGFFIIIPLFSASLEQIIEEAKKNNPLYQNILLSYEQNLAQVKKIEDGEKVGITLTGSVTPLYYTGPQGNESYSGSTSLGITLPNSGKTEIKLNMDLSSSYDDFSPSSSIALNLSHNFDFSGYVQNDDLDLSIKKYSSEKSRMESEYSFEKTIISYLSAILMSEKSLEQAKYNTSRQREVLERMEALGTYDTSSTTYLRAKESLESALRSEKNAQEQYSRAKDSYKRATLLEWDGIEGLEKPELELVIYEKGNTEVLLSSLALESSEEEYRAQKARLEPSLLTVGGNAKLSLGSSSSQSINLNATYTGPLWTLSVTPTLSIASGEIKPTLTLSGSWNNGGVTRDTPSSLLKSVEREVERAENNYLSSLTNYSEKAQSLRLEILSWEDRYKSALAEVETQRKIKEEESLRLELGLATQEALDKAILDELVAEYNLKTVILDGISLNLDLKSFAL